MKGVKHGLNAHSVDLPQSRISSLCLPSTRTPPQSLSCLSMPGLASLAVFSRASALHLCCLSCQLTWPRTTYTHKHTHTHAFTCVCVFDSHRTDTEALSVYMKFTRLHNEADCEVTHQIGNYYNSSFEVSTQLL